MVSVSHAVLVLGKGLAIYTEECLHYILLVMFLSTLSHWEIKFLLHSLHELAQSVGAGLSVVEVPRWSPRCDLKSLFDVFRFRVKYL